MDGKWLCLCCICMRMCTDAHLKYHAAWVPPAHLFFACSTCISAWLVFVSMSPCRQSFKDMNPCISGSPLLDLLRVAQLCKSIDLWAPFVWADFPECYVWRQSTLGASLCWRRGLPWVSHIWMCIQHLDVLHRLFLANKFVYIQCLFFSLLSLLSLDFIVLLQWIQPICWIQM